jgi:hypothetical protein
MGRQHAAAALLFIALSAAMTWPLAPNLGSAVSDPGDPYINTWILDWDWYATFHQPLSLFHANAFYPARYALAYSENLYGIAVLLFPLRAVGVGPLTAYNIAMLAGFAFSGFAMYLLGLRLTGSWAAGVAAGVFYAFVPFRFIQLSHVQHVWGGWLPLLLVMLLRYAERPDRRRAMAFAAVFVLNGLTNIHYLFFGAFAAGLTAVLLLPRRHWRELALAMAGALLLLAPFLYPYAAVAKLYGMQRSWGEVIRYSAVATDWLPGQTDAERKLYPGLLAYVTAAAALFVSRKRLPELALALLWIVIGFLGSLGLNFEFHSFLFGAVPGFRAIRVPARWAVIAYIGLGMLIALATAALARRNRWVALLVPVAFAVHLWQAPVRWFLADARPPEVYTWLAQQDVRGVIELPMDLETSDYEYLLRATAHHKPIVNGVSGFAPPLRDELSRLSREFSDALLDRLIEAKVDLVIVHADKYGYSEPVRAWLRRELERGRLAFVRNFHSPVQGDWVFRIVENGRAERPPLHLQAFLDGAPTCGSGVMAALDHPRNGELIRGGAFFSGWVVSPNGIASVDFWMNNRTYLHRATLVEDTSLEGRCPGRPDVQRARYLAMFRERPEGVWPETDVQVEVTDRQGRKTVLDDRWVRWE